MQVLYKIFEQTGIFSDALQDSQLEIDRSIRLKTTTIQSFSDNKTDEKFEKLFKICLKIAEENDLNEPVLPRQRRIPDRFKDSFPNLAQFNSVAEKYKDLYFKTIENNSIVNQIEERFDDDTLDLIVNEK